MKIVVLEKNKDYSNRLKFFMSKKFLTVQIVLFDDYDCVKEYIKKEKVDVVLFSSVFDEIPVKEIDELVGNAAFAYISETREIVNDRDTIFMYNSVSVLYSKICMIYEKKKNRVIKRNDNDQTNEKSGGIMTFLPVHGGAGSSTMAAACAIELSKFGEVLYINLEQCPSDQTFFFNDTQKSITDVSAMLKTKYTDNALYQCLRDVILKDNRYSGLSFIRGFTNIAECTSLNPQGLEAIFNILLTRFDFSSIIIDTDFIVGPLLKKLIVLSDNITFVSTGSDIASVKFAKILRYFEIISREIEDEEVPNKYLLLNQYYGSQNETLISHGIEIIGRLARYRTDDKSRITSHQIIEEVNKKDTFARFFPAPQQINT